MKITIKISTAGAAFEDDPDAETARILRELAQRFDYTKDFITPPVAVKLHDLNGNEVGYCKVTK